MLGTLTWSVYLSQVAPVQSEGSPVTAVYGPPAQFTALVCPLAGADKVPLLGVAAKAHDVMDTKQSTVKTGRIAFSSRECQAGPLRTLRVVLRLRRNSSLLPARWGWAIPIRAKKTPSASPWEGTSEVDWADPRYISSTPSPNGVAETGATILCFKWKLHKVVSVGS